MIVVRFNKKVAKKLGKAGFIKHFSKTFEGVDLAKEYDKMFPEKQKEEKPLD